jgi:uncharacterized membrane protein YgcG
MLCSALTSTQELSVNALDKVPLFRKCSADCKQDILGRIVRRYYSPGERIITQGDVDDKGMFFLLAGEANVEANGEVKLQIKPAVYEFKQADWEKAKKRRDKKRNKGPEEQLAIGPGPVVKVGSSLDQQLSQLSETMLTSGEARVERQKRGWKAEDSDESDDSDDEYTDADTPRENGNGGGSGGSGSGGSGSGSSSGSGSTRGHITVGTERGPEKGDPFWAYKAAQTVTVARRDMPIILLEAGTIVNLVQEHFEIGQTAVAGDAQGRARGAADREDHSAAAAGDGDGGGGGGGSGGGGGGSFLPAINPRKGAGAGAGVGAGTDANGYRIRFMNETAVTYLAIPRKVRERKGRMLGHVYVCVCVCVCVCVLCPDTLVPYGLDTNPSCPHGR